MHYPDMHICHSWLHANIPVGEVGFDTALFCLSHFVRKSIKLGDSNSLIESRWKGWGGKEWCGSTGGSLNAWLSSLLCGG